MSVTMISPPWNIEVKDVQIKKIIITQLLRRGEGVEDDPVRNVTQFWTMEGDIICEFDSIPPKPPTISYQNKAN